MNTHVELSGVWYRRLGVAPVINAAGRWTRLGGSLMAPAVIEAMRDSAGRYVNLYELQRRADEELARLTRNEAAYVSGGADAGVVLSLLACRTGADPIAIARLAEGRGPAAEVIVYRAQAGPHLPAVLLAGARPVEIGNLQQTYPEDLLAAVSDHTVAVLYVAGPHRAHGTLGLEATVEVAHSRKVPVIVDAADQLPPPENLWRFTRESGADLAVFSGGKDLGGPQASGLVVGSRSLVDALHLHGSPNERLARALKVGKEEIVGLVAAVECYLGQDWTARRARWAEVLTRWEQQLSTVPGVIAERVELNGAGQPIPRLLVRREPPLQESELHEIVDALLSGDPAVAVGWQGSSTLALTPEMVSDDEVSAVGTVVTEALGQRPGSMLVNQGAWQTSRRRR